MICEFWKRDKKKPSRGTGQRPWQRLGKRSGSGFIDDQCHFTRCAGVGNADMRPSQLADDLVIGQPRGHDRPHNRIRSHPWHSYVSRATKPVLAGITAPAGCIDCG